jgi:hypothetical protein
MAILASAERSLPVSPDREPRSEYSIVMTWLLALATTFSALRAAWYLVQVEPGSRCA